MDALNELLRSAAVLQVSTRTMQPMIDFFVHKLGFTIGSVAGNGPSFATLDRDGQTIMLNCAFGFFNFNRVKGWAVYFWVTDIETTFSEFVANGVPLKGDIVEKPYGCKEIVAIAPDGREIVFGQII